MCEYLHYIAAQTQKVNARVVEDSCVSKAAGSQKEEIER
jgi:hypothetical protein